MYMRHCTAPYIITITCEPAMVVATHLSRSRVMIGPGTLGRSSCKDVLVGSSQCPRAPISMVMSFAE